MKINFSFNQATFKSSNITLQCETDTNLLLGRSKECQISFDNKESLMISRKHARIFFEGESSNLNTYIEDLNSSNGTFVNNVKIVRPTLLSYGDTISLGINGPEFHIDLDPRPESFMAATQIISLDDIHKTEIFNIVDTKNSSNEHTPRETYTFQNSAEHNDKKNVNQSSSDFSFGMWQKVAAGISLPIIGIVLFLIFGNSKQIEPIEPVTETIVGPEKLSTSQIAEKYAQSVGVVSFGWKLVHTPTGEDIYHYYELINDVPTPVYIRTNTGDIEPYLVTKDYNNISQRIAINSRGSGFVFNSDGYMITNRHVAAGWEASYPLQYPGVLIEWDEKGDIVFTNQVNAGMVGHWIPTKTQMIDHSNVESDRSITGVPLFLNVQFPNNDVPLEASVSNYSLEADVAVIKVNSPIKFPQCPLAPNAVPKIGEEVVVLGYPGNSRDDYKSIRSQDITQRGSRYVRVVEPTLTNGTIAKIHETSSYKELSGIGGNVYQLNINTTGGGNSGGPVFNEYGEVIGIFTYSFNNYNELIRTTFAVPITYATKIAGI